MLLLKIYFENILARLRKSSFVKNFAIVLSGTAAAQALGFALSPVISRLYSPSDFGVLGSFDAIFSIIAAGATLDYTQAIMLPKQKEDAINLFILSCLSTIIISTCCLAVCLFYPKFLLDLMKASSAWMLVLLIVAIIVTGFNRTCHAWCIRSKKFKLTSFSHVIRSLSSNGFQVSLGFLRGGGGWPLIFSRILGDMLASVNLFRVILPDLLAFRKHIRWNRMKQLAKDYSDFPMYSASQNVINALSSGLAVLLITHFYGIMVAGTYAFGARILWTPMSFALAPLRQVLFQKASETHQDGGPLFPLYLKITSGLFALVLLPSLVMILWAPDIFAWIFGDQWYLSGEFARSLVIWLVFVFCNLPAVMFAKIIRIQRFVFFYDLLLLVARTSALVLGGLFLSASYTVMLFALVGAAMNAILILWVGYSLMKKEGQFNLDSIRKF